MQLLANPAFDAGHTAWTETTSSSSSIITSDSVLTTLRAHTPSNLAWLAGYANADDDLSQTITIPANASSITLSFYYVLQTQETTAGAFDTMDVYTYDPALAKYTALATFNDNMATPSYLDAVLDHPAAVDGRADHQGRLPGEVGHEQNTNFFIDSVALDVVACTP